LDLPSLIPRSLLRHHLGQYPALSACPRGLQPLGTATSRPKRETKRRQKKGKCVKTQLDAAAQAVRR
jgi:hypothetical protein